MQEDINQAIDEALKEQEGEENVDPIYSDDAF